MLILICKVESAFSYVRNPFMYEYEYPKDESNERNTADSFEIRKVVFAYNNRLKLLDEAMKELENSNYKLMAIFGERFKNSIAPLRKCRANLIYAIDEYIRSLRKGVGYYKYKHLEFDKIIYQLGDSSEQDYLTPKIREACEIIKKSIRPYSTNMIRDYLLQIGIDNQIKMFEIELPRAEKEEDI